MTFHPTRWKLWQKAAITALLLLLAVLLTWLSLVLHLRLTSSLALPWKNILEVVSIGASTMIFAVGWHSMGGTRAHTWGLASILFIGVTILDFLHMFTHQGPTGFAIGNSLDQGNSLYLSARILAALATMSFAFVPRPMTFANGTRQLVSLGVMAFVVGMGALALSLQQTTSNGLSSHWGLASTNHYTGIAIALLNTISAMALLGRVRSARDVAVLALLGAAVLLSLSDTLHILYASENEPVFHLAQLCRIIGYALIYRAMLLESVARRELLECKLDESEERYRLLIESLPDAIMVHRNGRFTYFNAAARQLVGASADKNFMGKPLLDLVHPESHQSVQDRLAKLSRGETVTPLAEIKLVRIDGTVVEVETQATTIIQGEIPSISVILRDITPRKKAEAAQAQLQTQLRESQKMEALGTLAGGIAHDFNNTLGTILGNTELARQDSTGNPAALESLDEIRKAANRARDLVQQILSFGRRQPTNRQPINLTSVVFEAGRLLRRTLPARVHIEVECAPNIPDVLADSSQIEQILLNLANNAVQALPEGSGRIKFRLDTAVVDLHLAERYSGLLLQFKKYPGLAIRITVSDNGMGMDANTMSRIFEPFFTTKAAGKGTGLGLAVVYGIVQSHEGAITVESSPGSGTEFAIYFPVAATHPKAVGPAPLKTEAVSPAIHSGRRVLFVDDDASMTFLVKRLLERRSYSVSSFTDQEAALSALRAEPYAFDLVLTDYNMPGLSGLDMVRAVREIRGDLPIAVASGSIDENLRARAIEMGVRELIFKAEDVEIFCQAVHRLLAEPAE